MMAQAEDAETEAEDTQPLRMADMDVKHRVFLEAQANGYTITYRRVKKTNELVISGRVYDEYTAVAELPHVLVATINGHRYEAGYTFNNITYIDVDGQRIAKKLRLF